MHEALELGHGFVVRTMHDRYVDKNKEAKKDAAALELHAVYLLEENPPAGALAVAWMLVMSLAAQTLPDAQTIAEYYTCRWVIEEWHRCLKEGCNIEESQLDDGEDIQRLSAILSVVALRLLQVRDLSELPAEHDTPGTLKRWVPPMFRLIVASLAKVDPSKLTPRKFHLTVAKRGGHLARRNDPRPGWKVLWRGWNDIVQMVRGAELCRKLFNEEKKCV